MNEAFDGYMGSWGEDQASKDRIHQNWNDTTMGYSRYTNPYTGKTTPLPYGPSGYPGGVYNSGTGTYMYTPGGPYEVGPGGFTTPMEDTNFIQNFLGR